MLNSDIRLQMSFYSNTKIKKLHKALGSDGVLSLVFLWLYTAENRPHGELRGMDADDIALAAQYQNDSENFVSTLKDMGFLDKKGKLYIVHDWEINNPWAANAPERKKQAQEAAKARWLKNKEKSVCSQHSDSMLPAYAPSPSPLPIPLPSPLPKERQKKGGSFQPPTIEEVSDYCRERNKGVSPEKWYDHYTANGWMVGKNKMKDWKAAIRTWEKESTPKHGGFVL